MQQIVFVSDSDFLFYLLEKVNPETTSFESSVHGNLSAIFTLEAFLILTLPFTTTFELHIRLCVH